MDAALLACCTSFDLDGLVKGLVSLGLFAAALGTVVVAVLRILIGSFAQARRPLRSRARGPFGARPQRRVGPAPAPRTPVEPRPPVGKLLRVADVSTAR